MEFSKPKCRQLGQDLAFSGNGFGENAIEGGNAVGGDDQESFPEIEYLANFPTAELFRMPGRSTDIMPFIVKCCPAVA